MAKGYLSLEVLSSGIRYTFIQKHQGFQLTQSGTSNYFLDVSDEGGFSAQIRSLIQDLEIDPEQIMVAISRQDTLVRQITLPKIDAEKEIENIIRSEIEKVPVFNDDEFDFIYHVYPLNNEKIKVIFAAIQKRILDYVICETQAVLPMRHLEITPLNLKELITGGEQDDNTSQVLLIVNNTESYFAIYKEKQYKLFYKTTLGLDNLYIEDEKEPDDKVLAGLTGELGRVLKAYLTENKEEVISKIWMVWDQEKGTGLNKFVEDIMGLKTDSLDFNIISGQKVDVIDKKAGLNPIYCLTSVPALFQITRIKPQFSLEHFFRALHVKRCAVRHGIFVGVFILLFGSIMGMNMYSFYQKKQALKQEIEEVDYKVIRLKAESVDLFARKQEYLDVREGLLNQATFIRQLNRVSWAEVFSTVTKDLPANLALQSFDFSGQQNVKFEGEAFAVETIADMIRSVDTSDIMQNGKFDHLTEKTEKAKNKGEEAKKYFTFGIGANLKKQAEDLSAEDEPPSPQKGTE